MSCHHNMPMGVFKFLKGGSHRQLVNSVLLRKRFGKTRVKTVKVSVDRTKQEE